MGARQVDEEIIRRWISENSPSPSLSYLVYTAVLTQSGTGAPVPTILGSNTIGVIVWTRTSAGLYKGTLNGAFVANKTFATVTNNGSISTSSSAGGGRFSDNEFMYQTFDIGSASQIDNDGEVYIEIRVYP